MFQFIKKLLGLGDKIDFAQLVMTGATIVDVRTKAEYQQGHIKGSVNIPLDSISNHLSKFKTDQTIITCCASGMRSAAAKNILKSNGFTEVHNGGGWTSLQNKITN